MVVGLASVSLVALAVFPLGSGEPAAGTEGGSGLALRAAKVLTAAMEGQHR